VSIHRQFRLFWMDISVNISTISITLDGHKCEYIDNFDCFLTDLHANMSILLIAL
jgi:hypothetical protein